MTPQLSIASCFCYEIPIAEQIRLVSEAGFTHLTLSVRAEHSGMLTGAGRRQLRSWLSDAGLHLDTVHAPSMDRDSSVSEIIQVIEAAHDLGAGRVVAHAGPFHCGGETADARYGQIAANCEQLIAEARKRQVVLAVENVMPGPATELARKLLREFDNPWLGFCYDSSHDQIDGPRPFDLLKELGSRLVAVHLSDRIKEFVDHVVPGEGFIDWATLCDRLAVIGYAGAVLMEVMMTHSRYQDPLEFLTATKSAAAAIWQAINKCGHTAAKPEWLTPRVRRDL